MNYILEKLKSKLAIPVLVIISIIFAASILLPGLSYENKFLDDSAYFHSNRLVQNPGFISATKFVKEVLSPSSVAGYYQPVTMISFMADYALGARSFNTGIVRVHNLILHLANMLFLMYFLYLLFENKYLSVFCGFLFSIHPIAVESISWISERKTLLATFYTLLTLILYIKYTKRGKNFIFYFLSEVTYILGFLSKPIVATLPLILIFIDFYPLNRSNLKTFFEKWRYGLISFALTCIMLYSQNLTGNMENRGEMGLSYNLFATCFKLKYYIIKSFFPFLLTPIVPWPSQLNTSTPEILYSTIFTGIFIVFLLVLIKFRSKLLLGLSSFLILLIPALSNFNLTAGSIVNFRYLYLPSVGIIIALFTLLTWFWEFAKVRNINLKIVTSIFLVSCLILTLYFSYNTRVYLSKWETTTNILENILGVYPDFPMIEAYLGWNLFEEKQYDKSFNYCVDLLQKQNFTPKLQLKIFETPSNISIAKRDYKSSLEFLQFVIPGYQRVGKLWSIAEINFLKGNLDEAQRLCNQGISNDFYTNECKIILAKVMISEGNFQDALQLINQVKTSDDKNPQVYIVLGQINYLKGNLFDAVVNANEAISYDESNYSAYLLLSKIYGKQGRLIEESKNLKLSQQYDTLNMGWPAPYENIEKINLLLVR